MSIALEFTIEGIGICATGLPDWDTARAILCGEREYLADAAIRPAPALLSANERRRAPESVLLALGVAEAACAMAGREPRTLPNVFASAYGDLAINDYLCAELARAPLDLSPTKFHNSVHNAAAGYWTIASGCMHTSSAISAGVDTFAAGLLEAALLAVSESTPVLYAVYDTAASGPLADVIATRMAFGAAFVLSPTAAANTMARVRIAPGTSVAAPLAPLPSSLHALQAACPAAASLPLLAAIARCVAGSLPLCAAPSLHLEISF
jgi:hypothetical protein